MTEWNKVKSNKNNKNKNKLLPAKPNNKVIPAVSIKSAPAKGITKSKNKVFASPEEKDPPRVEEIDYEKLFAHATSDVSNLSLLDFGNESLTVFEHLESRDKSSSSSGSANKTKPQVKNVSQKTSEFWKKNSPSSSSPNLETEKSAPGGKKCMWSDEDYEAGFAENRKRVARTPPEIPKKAVRKLDEELDDSKKLKDFQTNPHGESREEINPRQITEVKDCMDVEETKENSNMIEESSTRTGEIDDRTDSSSLGGDSSSAEDSSSEEETVNEKQHCTNDKPSTNAEEKIRQGENTKSNVPDQTSKTVDENYINDKHVEEIFIYVKAVEEDITKINPHRVHTKITRVTNRKTKITRVNKSLKITCESEDERQSLLKISHLAGHRVEFSEPYTKSSYTRNQNLARKGIIFDVEEEISTDELENILGIPAQRIIKRRSGHPIITKQIILHFRDVIPDYVHIGWRRFRVRQYIPDPVWCYNCQKYGHIAANCRSKTTCPICSGKHSYEDCEVQNLKDERKAICPNCRGDHPASYKGCPAYQEAKTIKRVQTTNAISYAEAVKTIRNQDNTELPRSNNTLSEQNKPATPAELSNKRGNDIPRRTEVNVHAAPPNVNKLNQVNAESENTHQQCVKIELLTEFFQSFTTVLLTGMSFSPDSKEIIAKLCQLVDGFLKSINKQTK